MVNLPIDQLKEHPKQNEFFKPLEGKAWEEFYTDLNTRGIQQPVIVSDRTGEWVIADGHQRVRAAKYLGWREVPCVMGAFESEPEEVRCLVMNNARRRQLSRIEIENIIGYWLRNYSGRSNNWIASDIGTTDKTVEAKRVEMEATSEIPKLDKLEGKDGKTRPRSQPRQSKDSSVAESYLTATSPVSAVSIRETEVEKGLDDNDPLQNTAVENVCDTYEIEPRPNIVVDAPQKPPGWEATQTRKQLERAAEIITRMDADEAREEIERDRFGTLRPFILAAYKQLGEMLEGKEATNLITIKN